MSFLPWKRSPERAAAYEQWAYRHANVYSLIFAVIAAGLAIPVALIRVHVGTGGAIELAVLTFVFVWPFVRLLALPYARRHSKNGV